MEPMMKVKKFPKKVKRYALGRQSYLNLQISDVLDAFSRKS